MVLLLDIGNTFLKWVCREGDSRSCEGELLHAGEELADVFSEAWDELAPPTAVHVANVAGVELAESLDSWLQDNWNVSAHYAETQEQAFGVQNAYQVPGQLGVDRWLAMLAAWNQYHSAVCVIDCGTALTVDAIDANGQHLGGLITPGLGMMRDSLLVGADGIELEAESALESADSLLAHNTQGGVEVGSLYAVLAFIDRIQGDLQRELGDEMRCILTGGDAPDIAPLLAQEVSLQPQLVLDGLALGVSAPV